MNVGYIVVGSALATVGAIAARVIVAGFLAGESAGSVDIVAGGGVFGLIISVVYWFVKRGDTQAKEQAAATQAQLKEQNDFAQAQLKAQRDEMSLLRADVKQSNDKLVDALVENGQLHQQIADLAIEVARLRDSKEPT